MATAKEIKVGKTYTCNWGMNVGETITILEHSTRPADIVHGNEYYVHESYMNDDVFMSDEEIRKYYNVN